MKISNLTRAFDELSLFMVSPASPQRKVRGHRVTVITIMGLLMHYSETLIDVDTGMDGVRQRREAGQK
jgi:hypothetical protein